MVSGHSPACKVNVFRMKDHHFIAALARQSCESFKKTTDGRTLPITGHNRRRYAKK
jgi:hypothetical protein